MAGGFAFPDAPDGELLEVDGCGGFGGGGGDLEADWFICCGLGGATAVDFGGPTGFGGAFCFACCVEDDDGGGGPGLFLGGPFGFADDDEGGGGGGGGLRFALD